MPGADRRQILISFVATLAATLSSRQSNASNRPLAVSADAAAVRPATAGDWQSVIENMFPHSGIDRKLYSLPANALVQAATKDAATRQLLDDGWLQLNRAANDDWTNAPPAARISAIASSIGTPLFILLRQTTVFTFYGDTRVWDAFGYEGDAWRFGGYQDRVNTIDWLPDPPGAPAITE